MNRAAFRTMYLAGPAERPDRFFEVHMQKRLIVEDLPIQFSMGNSWKIKAANAFIVS